MDKRITLPVSGLLTDMNRYYLLLALLAGVAILFFLTPGAYFELTQRDFLPLHTLLEFLAVLAAFMVFGVTWHSLSSTRSASITLLGCAMLASGLLDFAHTLSYNGMPDFVTPSSPEKSIAFWLADRLAVAAALCAASFMSTAPLRKPQTRYALLFGFSLYTLLIYWLVLFHQSALPLIYVEGHGLAGFGIACEWGIIGLLGIAASRFWRPACNTDTPNLKTCFFTVAMIFIISEMLSIQYKTTGDAFNVLSHLYKIMGYLLLYKAVFVTTIQAPYHEIGQQQTRYRQLFESMSSCCVVYQAVDNGKDFIFIEVNHATERTEKTGRDNFIGQRLAKLFPSAVGFGLPDRLRQVWRTGQSERFPVKYYQDGHIVGWRENLLYRLPDGNIVAIYDDITERKLAEQALQESENNFRAIFETAAIGMAEADPVTGRFLLVNLRLCQMTGYSAEELLSKTFTMITHPDDQERDLEGLRRIACGEIAECVTEKRYIHKDGHELWAHSNVVALHDENGMILRTLAVIADITERKQLERQLQQSMKMEALGLLTGGIAHDFNNILAVMLGYSDMALTRYATDKDSKLALYLEEIVKAGERGRDLVACMLTYSRRQTNEVTAAMAPAPLVKEVLKMLVPTIPAGIKLEDQIDADTLAIYISPGELHQIVMNLVINARDAMVEHGCLDIRLSTLVETPEFCMSCKRAGNKALCQNGIYGEYVSLTVTDTGCGISPENFKLVFDPFFSTKDVGKGTGLGLSMIYSIVQRYSGCILVDSHLGRGSTFQVLFPVADATKVLPTSTATLSTISGGNGARILVVDDEPALAHYLGDLLEGENYVVDVYTDSVEALNYFRANPQSIDAVITDQTMPGKSGIEIASVMLALRPELPVFLCSGYSDAIDENTQLFGIRRFFNKPVSATQLLIALDEEITHPARV